jgi:hypothetical protein
MALDAGIIQYSMEQIELIKGVQERILNIQISSSDPLLKLNAEIEGLPLKYMA